MRPLPVRAVAVDAATTDDVTTRTLPSVRAQRLRTFGTSRVAVIAFLVVAVPAVALRTWELTALGYNSDEAVYAGQAASLSGNAGLLPFFPVFRAHPLLFQSMLSLVYDVFGYSDVVGRLAAVAFGLGTVAVVFFIGRLMYGRRVGFVAALIMAVMPYAVVVSRQVLLDGPMTFFATLSLYFVARFADSRRALWLYSAAATLGLMILAKETSVLILGGVYAFFALTPAVRIRLRQLVPATLLLIAVIVIYPLTVLLAGASSTGSHFLTWQLLRRANHSWMFYPSVLPPALGWPVVIAAVVGLVALRRHSDWRRSLLVWWVVGPVLFFEVWSVKGFQYLLPIAAPVAVLAAQALVALGNRSWGFRGRRVAGSVVSMVAVGLTALFLAYTSWLTVDPGAPARASWPAVGVFLAGAKPATGWPCTYPRTRRCWRWDRRWPTSSSITATAPSTDCR